MIQPSIENALSKKYHSPQLSVTYKLNTNESPVSPPDGFVQEFARRLDLVTLNRYPDRMALELRKQLARYLGREPEEIFVANGSNEVLQTIFLSYGGPGRTVAIADPTYAMYRQIAGLTRTGVYDWPRNEAGYLDPATLSECDIVMVCDPNNPTGMSEPPDLGARLGNDLDRLVVVDRAYAEFSSAKLAAFGGRNVIEVRTFSKAFAMAGARIGYAIADPEVVDVLYATCLPYHLDSLKQILAREAIAHASELTAHVELVIKEREFLLSELSRLPLKLWPSQTNFILFSPLNVDANKLWDELVARSVLIRNAVSWPGVEGSLRVTVGTPEENRAFLSALIETLS
jgi:histidinol-phosphate aminotransferase